MFSAFLSSYKNTRESLGELEKDVETLLTARVHTAFLVLSALPLEFLKLDRNTVHVFYCLNKCFFEVTFRRNWLVYNLFY